MREIPLSQGYFAQVDDEDFEYLSGFKWHCNIEHKTVYAQGSISDGNGRWKTIKMHRLLLNVSDPSVHVDHIDGNGLNNTRGNLRPCTRSQNQMNRKSCTGSSSRFKGVVLDKKSGMWRATIGKNGKTNNIGLFENEEDAARAYNQWAKKYHGEFANYNQVTPTFPLNEYVPKLLLSNNTSGFRGISFYKPYSKWVAFIRSKGKRKCLGYFNDPILAATAYDNSAKELHGEKARLNFPKKNDNPRNT